eukprot:6985486-Lingulodinium_polyedra.AAC.1
MPHAVYNMRSHAHRACQPKPPAAPGYDPRAGPPPAIVPHIFPAYPPSPAGEGNSGEVNSAVDGHSEHHNEIAGQSPRSSADAQPVNEFAGMAVRWAGDTSM